MRKYVFHFPGIFNTEKERKVIKLNMFIIDSRPQANKNRS